VDVVLAFLLLWAAAPELPKARGTFIDPVYGATLMRVTDGRDGDSCVHAYSTWPVFNRDSTAFFLACDSQALLYRFDPEQFKILRKQELFAWPPKEGFGRPAWEDAFWSAKDAHVLYAREGPRIWAYDIATKKYALVKDFGKDLPDGAIVSRMSVSDDDNVFAFTRQRPDLRGAGFAVWRRDTDRIVAKEPSPGDYKVWVDKSGGFVTYGVGADVVVVNLETGGETRLSDPAPDFAPGHGDTGHGLLLGYENWQNRVLRRELANPRAFTVLLDAKDDWTQESHYSLRSEDESWLLVSQVTHTAKLLGPGPNRDEVFLLATDGSGKIRPVARHYSVYRDYWDSPRAAISRDGRFAAFTSNWGKKRRDVFLVKIPR
jgi:hypothetical protein